MLESFGSSQDQEPKCYLDSEREPSEQELKIYEETRKCLFNYSLPFRDENWKLLPRKIQTPESIEDGYDSIYDLFTKLNSITDTQIEPLYPPYYYWEINDETWEKIKTYIIVWDIHADEYNENTDKNSISYLMLWDQIIVEEDESYFPEVSALRILKEKFWIENIWLENELNWRDGMSLIWKNADISGIEYVGLEDIWVYFEAMEAIIIRLTISIKLFEIAWLELKNYDISDKEYQEIQEEPFMQEILSKVSVDLTYNENKLRESFNKINILTMEQKEKYYKFVLKYNEKMFSYLSSRILNDAINEISSSIDELASSDLVEQYKQKSDSIVEKRNEVWIKILSESMWDDQVWVMVYWKWHIENLIEQLKSKYDWKVNIYVAK